MKEIGEKIMEAGWEPLFWWASESLKVVDFLLILMNWWSFVKYSKKFPCIDCDSRPTFATDKRGVSPKFINENQLLVITFRTRDIHHFGHKTTSLWLPTSMPHISTYRRKILWKYMKMYIKVYLYSFCLYGKLFEIRQCFAKNRYDFRVELFVCKLLEFSKGLFRRYRRI